MPRNVMACTTCHIIVEEGFTSLEDASDDEEDLLDKAWGLETSRWVIRFILRMS